MNCFNWLEQWALTCRLSLTHRLQQLASARSPAAFRKRLLLKTQPPATFSSLMQPWQQQDFAALDPAWMDLAGMHPGSTAGELEGSPRSAAPDTSSSRPVLRRAWIERPRGHAKTSDTATQIAWILLHARQPLVGLAAAADRDQAALLLEELSRLARRNPRLCRSLRFRKHHVTGTGELASLQVISSDVQSSWGLLPDFIICDELCHWEKPDMWFSLLSSAAKQPRCLLQVLTNAGVGTGWHWQARQAARESSAWYFSSLAGPRAPWITANLLAEQRQLLPPSVYDRLWNNRWQHTGGEFVTLAEAEACRDQALTRQAAGQPGRTYIAAIDYAEKHDHTVGLVLHHDGSRLVVDRLDVVVPTTDSPTPVAWVHRWMEQIRRDFPEVTFVIDEYQLLGTIQSLATSCRIHRFPFAGGRGNHALAVNLRRLIIERQLAWYPGCGQLPESSTRDDLETELASLLLKQSPGGHCRIDHRSAAGCHDDRCFALGAACLYAIEQQPKQDFLTLTPPSPAGGFQF